MSRLTPEDLARGSMGDEPLDQRQDETDDDSADMGLWIGLLLIFNLIAGFAFLAYALAS